ncbi:MAG: hypothetical protein Q8K46_05455, partial [Deltaproteobacteria bacterium]|nr:hypothetical protein [Deltaproteobacteria bacterium]
MRRNVWRIAGCFLLLVCSLLLIIGCGKKEKKQVKERIANVRVQPAEKKQLRPFVAAIGTLKAYDEVVVSSEVEGIISNITVDEGSIIGRGAMLATVAATDYELEVKRSDAAVKQVEASYENTRLEYQRKQALYKEELLTKQQFEDVTT